ncbi:MAG: exodeoxyribonuclease VII small subunit [Lachnospiraceae bacterium]|nr:exodeoxyribonuclease VII small subunit [Lachnospiraceae bacterium]
METEKNMKIDNSMETDDKEFTLEETFQALEETIGKLEGEDISLEESFQAYQSGMELLKQCNDKIDRVEKKVLVLNEKGGLDEFAE